MNHASCGIVVSPIVNPLSECMKFRTEYKPGAAPFLLNPGIPTMLVGSCFADNIGKRMRACLWKAYNPLSVLYNPLSIEKALRSVLDDDGSPGFLSSLFEKDGVTRSWLFDSKLSSEFRADTVAEFRRRRAIVCDLLGKAQALFVTFGTSFVYSLSDNPEYIVANCHKQPSAMFLRRRLGVAEITDVWESLANDLKERFPRLHIVFTVSPVRHLKDGFAGNSHSKAVLLLAVEELCSRLDFCHYFPAYEIVNDDLRDYRFYASDLVHPSEEAVEYIWEIFKATYLDAKGMEAIKEGEGIVKAWRHRQLPDATKEPSPERLRRQNEWKESIKERYGSFAESFGEMLPLEYPFDSDPGFM